MCTASNNYNSFADLHNEITMAASLVAKTSDGRFSGREFEPQPLHCRVKTLGMLFTPMCLCHQAV